MIKHSVLIIDDNKDWCHILKTELGKCSSFEVVKPLYNGKDAIDFIIDYTPDIIVLDMLIPLYDGLYIINYIRYKIKGYHPFIYVLSAVGVNRTAQLMQNLHVDYYSVKPIDPSAVLDNLFRLAVEINSSSYVGMIGEYNPIHNGNVILNSLNMDEMIDDYLYELGVVLYKKSTQCTHEVIAICLNDESNIGKLGDAYAAAADKLGGSATKGSVERNIRTTVSTVKKIANAFSEKCFTDELGMLTNSLFISKSVYILKRRIEDILDDQLSSR